jgi:hypothetical protein
MLLNAKILSSTRTNVAYVILNNLSNRDYISHFDEVRFMFDYGNERLSTEASEFPVRALSKTSLAIPFPSKHDFKSAKRIEVNIPFREQNAPSADSCVVKLVFDRDLSHAQTESTYTDRSAFEVGFALGKPFSRTGPLSQFADLGLALGADLAVYRRQHHGAYFDLIYEGRRPANRNYAPMPAGTSYNFDGTLVSVGYSYRSFLSERLNLRYDIGPGVYLAGLGIDSLTYSALPAFAQKISLYYRFLSPAGELQLGIDLYDSWVISGTVAEASARGNVIGLMFGIKTAAF